MLEVRHAQALGAVLAVFLVAAGCVVPVPRLQDPDDVRTPVPYAPTSGHKPWTSTNASAWMAGTHGCGFCSGSGNPEVETIVVYESGEILWFRYGTTSANPNTTRVAAGLEAYRAELADVASQLRNGYVSGRGVVVHEVATSRLEGDEWKNVHEVLENGQANAKDPGPANHSNCADCSSYHLELLDERVHAQLYGNYADGDPWDRLLEQLQLVSTWVKPWKEP